jgi:hypothetical protein
LCDGGPVGEQTPRQGSPDDAATENANANFHKAGDGTEARANPVLLAFFGV